MSVFTNPAASSAEEADAYVHAVLELLEDRDPDHVLSTTATAIREAIAGMSEEALSEPETRGKWSVREVLRHLADSEIVWGYRLRLVLAQDRPRLTGYDQDAWADRLGYADAPVGDSLDEFAVTRRGNLRLLERASPDDLQRLGLHDERGEESVEHMIRLYAGHDLLHLAQIDRIKLRVLS